MVTGIADRKGSQLKSLIRLELLKLTKENKSYYGLAAILLIEGIIFLTAYLQGSTILDILLDSLKQSFYFEGSLLNGNLILYIVLNALWFNVPLIIMIITSSLITDEYKDGTMQSLLLQATDKRRLIAAKYLSAAIYTLFVLLVMALSAAIFAYSIFGYGDLVVYLDSLNFFPAGEAVKRIALSFLSGTISMLFYTACSVTLAICFKEAARAWMSSAFVLIVINLLLKVDFHSELLNSYFVPKLIDSWQQLFYYEFTFTSILFNNLLLLLYTLGVALIGAFIFVRKSI